jgi:hypothetical protein
MFIQKSFELTPHEKSFVDHVLGSDFPWFFQKTLKVNSRFKFFGHTLMNRDPEFKPVTGVINSPHYLLVKLMFARFCEENGIKINHILRASFNTTLYDPAENSTIHIDHNFEHHNFLLYLNEFDNGSTLIYDKDNNIVQTIIPKKYDAVVFSGLPHANQHCAVGQRRVVLVITFN